MAKASETTTAAKADDAAPLAGVPHTRARAGARPRQKGQGTQDASGLIDARSRLQASPLASPFPPIADYGFLSDCHTGALVASDGSIEWM